MAKDTTTTEQVYEPYEAVFIGSKGETLGGSYRMLDVYSTVLYYDANNNLMDTTLPEYQGKTPQEMKKLGAVERKVYQLEIGGIVNLPVWEDEKLQLALKSQQFAKPDAAELIKQAHTEAYAASEKKGGDKELYAARIQKLLDELESKGLILTPADGEFVKPKYEGS